jgi:hypothetical protein
MPNRVVVRCTHTHCTPWLDEYAQLLVEKHAPDISILDTAWCSGTLDRIAEAARQAMSTLQRLVHLGTGRAKVNQVASGVRPKVQSEKTQDEVCPIVELLSILWS